MTEEGLADALALGGRIHEEVGDPGAAVELVVVGHLGDDVHADQQTVEPGLG